MIWTSVTTFFAAQLEASWAAEEFWYGWERMTKILLMALATLFLMQSRERIHALVWVIVVSIGFYGIKGAFWFMTSTGGWVFGPAGSFIGDNTSLALALIMIIPLLRYLQTISAILWVQFGLVMAGLGCVASIVGSYSRGAFIAAVAMIIMLVMRSRRRLLLGALAIGVAMAVGLYAPERWVGRIQSIANYQVDSSAMGRLQAWEFAINLSLDRPFAGGGFRAYNDPNLWVQFAPEGAIPRAYHSIYFQMLGDHGFVGLGIFLLLGLAGWAAARRVIRLTRDRPDLRWANELARMTQVSIVGFAVGGAFLSLAGFDLYYHLLGIAFLLQVVVERELGIRQSQPPVFAVGVVDPSAERRASSPMPAQRPTRLE
jgi:probable O-glycosylation ligase (exosortase A-associated)